MAARLRKHHQEDVKQKIQATQLVNFLQNHALDDKPASSTRIDAAKFLLNKTLSNAPTDLDITADVTNRKAVDLTDDQLAEIANARD
jgi:hypothetical protein